MTFLLCDPGGYVHKPDVQNKREDNTHIVFGQDVQQSVDQPGMVANLGRGQLDKENIFPRSPFAPDNLVSRDEFGRPVLRHPGHSHTQVESGAYLLTGFLPLSATAST